MGRMTQPTAS